MSELSKRYNVLTEGREDIPGFIVLPGAVRMPHGQDIIPVTLEYDKNRYIGAATGFQRSPVINGFSKVSMAIRFTEDSGITHDQVRESLRSGEMKFGVFINNIFAYNPFEVIFSGKYITDGIIQEIALYSPFIPRIH